MKGGGRQQMEMALSRPRNAKKGRRHLSGICCACEADGQQGSAGEFGFIKLGVFSYVRCDEAA